MKLRALAEIGCKSRKGLILKLCETITPKKTRWGHIVHTAMAKILKKGDQKCLYDVYNGFKKISENHG